MDSKRKENIANLIYFTGLLLIISVKFLMNTSLSGMIEPLYRPITITAEIVFIIKYLAFQKNSSLNVITFLCLEILAFINYKYSKNADLLYLMPVIFASKDMDAKRIVGFFMKLIAGLLGIVIVLALLGKIPDFIFSYNANGITVTRRALGMVYPTTLGAALMYLTFSFLVYKKFELSLFQKIMIFVMAFVVKEVAYAKTAMILLCVAGFIAIFYNPICRFLKKSSVVVPLLLLVIIFSSLYITYKFNTSSSSYQIVNSKIFSNRLYLGYVAVMTYPIKLFGQYIYMRGYGGQVGYLMNQGLLRANYFYIDNFYLQLLLIYGLITFIVVLGVIFYFAFKFNKERKFALVIILLLIVVDNVFEAYMFQYSFNFMLLLLLANTKKLTYEEKLVGNNEKKENFNKFYTSFS